MQKDKIKIIHHTYQFELQFKTDYCLSMTAIDVYDARKYQNKNVEFSKIKKESIIAALEDRNLKEIKCKITEEVAQKLEEKDEQRPILRDKCLRVAFIVEMDYIQSFTENAILYEVESCRRVQNIVPKKLTKQTANQLKKQIKQIQEALPTDTESCQQSFQIHEVSSVALADRAQKQDRIIIIFIAYNVFALILWMTYLTFLETLFMVAISVVIGIVYYRSKKFLLKQIQLKKGTYKITVSGNITVQNSTYYNDNSFVIHAQLGQWESKKQKIFVNTAYSYPYPFCTTFLIRLNQMRTLSLKVQKNTKIYPTNLSNVIITVEMLSHFGHIQ